MYVATRCEQISCYCCLGERGGEGESVEWLLAMSYATVSDILSFSRDSSGWQSNSPTFSTTYVRRNRISVATPEAMAMSLLTLSELENQELVLSQP